jgi:hypothetical protein
MSTSVWSTVIDHTSHAGFQAWATELIVKLLAVNVTQLTQTADTGQLANPVVAARPSTNTAAGYWILKWDDGVTTPLYFKVEPGTGGSATIPMIWITVGTGTDGAGTITGKLTSRTQMTQGAAPLSTTTNYTSYLCCDTGAFSLVWKTLSVTGSRSQGFMSTVRSIDDSGVVNNDGYVNYLNSGSNSITAQCVNMTNGVVFSTTTNVYCLVPYAITSSVVGGDAQYFRHFAAYPLARPLGHIVSCINSEFSVGTSFSGESGSITDHTFLSIGTSVGNAAAAGGTTAHVLAILWQ